jgi:hypothetical protein
MNYKYLFITLLLLFAPCAFGAPSEYDLPDGKYEVEANPQQPKNDKKVLNNLLKFYVGLRKVAKDAVSTMNGVANIAGNIQSYMVNVYTVCQRVEILSQQIDSLNQRYGWDDLLKPKNWDNIVIDLEEDIMQNSDQVIWSVQSARRSRHQIGQSVVQFAINCSTLVGDSKATFGPPVQAFKAKCKLFATSIAIRRNFGEWPGHVSSSAIAQAQYSKAIVTAEVDNAKAEMQNQQLLNGIANMADSNGNYTPMDLAKSNQNNAINALSLGLQNIDKQDQLVRTQGLILTSHAYSLNVQSEQIHQELAHSKGYANAFNQ